MAAKSLVLTGYGINSEEETSFAFEAAGFQSTVRHINDLAENPNELMMFRSSASPADFPMAMTQDPATPSRKKCA